VSITSSPLLKCLSLLTSSLKSSALERLDKSQPIEYSDDNQSMINQDALQFFELVHLADLIQQMIEVYFSEDIKPWIDEADFLSDISVEKKAFERFLVL
jgi:recyclin-1